MKTLKLLTAGLFCLIAGNVQAQAPQWQWANAIDEYAFSSIEGYSVVTDANGNVYTTGAFHSDTINIGGINHVSPGGGLYVIKYDTAGTILWARTDGRNDVNVNRGIAIDADGNLFVAVTFIGDSAVFGGTILYNPGAPIPDICIVKYDTNGNILWAISAGTMYDEEVEGLSADPNGNLFVTGYFTGPTWTVGGSTLLNPSMTQQIFLAKLDQNGIFLWAVSAEGNADDLSTSVSCDAFGNAVICGVYYSDSLVFDTANVLVSPYGSLHDQLYVAKFDSAGTLSWAQQVTLTEQAYDSYFYDVATDQFGNVFAMGSCKSDTIFVDALQLISSPTSVRDMLLVKYSAGGFVQWARREIGAGNVFGFDLSVNSSGEAYATGFFDGDSIVFGTDTTLVMDPLFSSAMFLVKYNSAGTVDWATNVNGTYMPGTYGYRKFGVSCDNAGRVAVAGTFAFDSIAIGNIYVLLNNSFPNSYVAMLNDADPCDASFTLVADTAMLHHYWVINQATGTPPLSYLWDWGDGVQSTGAYPAHTYSTAAFYTICLTITDATGCTDTHCETSYLERPSDNAAMVDITVVPSIPTDISEMESKSILIYPNPASDFLTLVNCENGKRIEIIDVYGKLLSQENVVQPSNTKKINLAGISNGVYFVKVYFDDEEVIRKFVVMGN